MTLTKHQKSALRLLVAHGGARYGTRIIAMKELRDMWLAYAYDKGGEGPGRWTWRPTPLARETAQKLGLLV